MSLDFFTGKIILYTVIGIFGLLLTMIGTAVNEYFIIPGIIIIIIDIIVAFLDFI